MFEDFSYSLYTTFGPARGRGEGVREKSPGAVTRPGRVPGAITRPGRVRLYYRPNSSAGSGVGCLGDSLVPIPVTL